MSEWVDGVPEQQSSWLLFIRRILDLQILAQQCIIMAMYEWWYIELDIECSIPSYHTLQPLIGYDPNLKVNLESFFKLNYTNVSTKIVDSFVCTYTCICIQSDDRGVLGVCCSHGERMVHNTRRCIWGVSSTSYYYCEVKFALKFFRGILYGRSNQGVLLTW